MAGKRKRRTLCRQCGKPVTPDNKVLIVGAYVKGTRRNSKRAVIWHQSCWERVESHLFRHVGCY